MKRNVVIHHHRVGAIAQSVCVEHSADCKLHAVLERGGARPARPSRRCAPSTRRPRSRSRSCGAASALRRAARTSTPRRCSGSTSPPRSLDGTYFTSQNLLFGNSGTWLEGAPDGRAHVSATRSTRTPRYETGADDGNLVDYVASHLDGAAGAARRRGAPVEHALPLQGRSRRHALRPAGGGDRPRLRERDLEPLPGLDLPPGHGGRALPRGPSRSAPRRPTPSSSTSRITASRCARRARSATPAPSSTRRSASRFGSTRRPARSTDASATNLAALHATPLMLDRHLPDAARPDGPVGRAGIAAVPRAHAGHEPPPRRHPGAARPCSRIAASCGRARSRTGAR